MSRSPPRAPPGSDGDTPAWLSWELAPPAPPGKMRCTARAVLPLGMRTYHSPCNVPRRVSC
eukprot:3532856-Prymnesium_polylepis.1